MTEFHTSEEFRTPILETERLILRPLSSEDAETIYTNWSSDPDVARYMSWNVHTDVSMTREWLAFEDSVVNTREYYTFGYVLKESGELIGSGGINYIDEKQCYIIGYNLMKTCWGKGLATEAAKRIFDFAVNELGIKTIYAFHATDNPASGRVLTKIGLIYTNDGVFVSDDGSKRYPRKEYRFDADK